MYKFQIFWVATLALSLGTLLADEAISQDALVLNTTVSEPLSNREGTGVTDLQLREVFKRAQIDFVIEHLPAERALINANTGIDDGTFLRISGLIDTFSSLIMVPESFMDFEFVAISKGKGIVPDGWASLDPYNLGVITGWKIVEDNTGNSKGVTKVDSVDHLFQLLSLNRVDLIIYEKLRALVALQENPVENAVILEPPLVRKPMFLYLNVKHSDLVPKIAAALRASKADGTHGRLQIQALQRYQPPN